MKRLSLQFLLCLLLWPFVVTAQNSYEHATSGLRFASQMGDFVYAGITAYDDPRFGVQVRYQIPGFGYADIYLYTLGKTMIPDDTSAATIQNAFNTAEEEIVETGRAGHYANLKKESAQGAVLHIASGNRDFLMTRFAFEIGTPARPVKSWLLLTGLREHFLKIRFSHRADDEGRGEAAIKALLEAFMENNAKGSVVFESDRLRLYANPT